MPGSRIRRSRAMPASVRAWMRASKKAVTRSNISPGGTSVAGGDTARLHHVHHDQPGGRLRQLAIERGLGKAVNIVEIVDALAQRPALHLGRETVDGKRKPLLPSGPEPRRPAGRSRYRARPAIASGWEEAAPMSMMSAPLCASDWACKIAAPACRYLPPSEKLSLVMLRMPRIFMGARPGRALSHKRHKKKRGGISAPFETISICHYLGCGSGEMIGPGLAGRGLPAAGTLVPSPRGGQHRVLIGGADRRNALEQRA